LKKICEPVPGKHRLFFLAKFMALRLKVRLLTVSYKDTRMKY
jgi:hypothetical protein